MSGAPSDTATIEPQRAVRSWLGRPRLTPSITLMIWQLLALGGQVAAVSTARLGGIRGLEHLLSNVSFAVAFGSALWLLLRPRLTRSERNLAVASLAVTPALMWRATNPLLFTGFDEQLHMRTLRDLVDGKSLFDPNPILEVSARYPGLEAITALVHQLGLPVLAAATTVIFVARLALVATLCDVVEQLTGSERAGGLAVATYALSPQFIFFNSQFSYQTVALPLALGAVSLIARSRYAHDPVPLYTGATVCLVALAMTHHLTSFVTTGFLLVWALVEKGRARVSILYGALAGVASTLAWAGVQSKMLRNYLKPIFDDYRGKFTGGVRRQVFSEAGGATSPLPDKLILVYYAGVLCLTVAALLLLAWRKRRLQPLRGPHLLLLALTALLPALCAAFLLPKGGEIFYRSSSLLFFPLSLLVARNALQLIARPEPGAEDPEGPRMPLRHKLIAVALLALMFVGGFVLGSGPFWSRLPGPYIAVADTRSMDAETLAAVEWAERWLPPGSRIAGDRVSSTLLASRAGLWPVLKGPPRVDAAALYVAPRWGQKETDMAASMRLRYLYVDRRLALERPRFGFYFQQGETGDGKQLTDAQLTKFDAVKGIDVAYRHGPVTIYDLKNLGIPDDPTGRFETAPHPGLLHQIGLGVAHGAVIVGLMLSRWWPGLVARAKGLYRAAGPALTVVIGLAAACLLAVTMLLIQLWPTPLVVLTAAVVVMLANPRRTASGVGNLIALVPWQHARAALAVGLAGGLILGVAVISAAGEVDVRVREILQNTAHDR
jgi:hypothetical protein